MHDIRYIRENSSSFDESLQNRNAEAFSEKILGLDKNNREVMSKLQSLQARRNEIASQIGIAKRNGQDAADLENESTSLKSEIILLEQRQKEVAKELREILMSLPNIPLSDVPVGKDESANLCVRTVGEVPVFNFTPKHHYDLGETLGFMDFQVASKVAGSRFTILRGPLAKLERALKDFMLDTHVQEFGYQEISVPLLVKSDCMFGTGQLPKFAEDSFRTIDDRWLIPTAEVPLTNMFREMTIPLEQLPIRVTAFSSCFRSEAGAAGRDTRGMIRNHQFSKVELVSIVHPDEGERELERMTSAAELILQKLGLAYRVMLLSTGDMGFSARKTYDLEVWLPSENTYREISSCSLCGEFQARRMNSRYKGKDDKGYVATLNGSGLAIGRTIVAILENYQREDGSIKIPDVLVPYMGGLKEIK